MSLAEHTPLRRPGPVAPAIKSPKGFEPGVAYEPGSMLVTTGPMPHLGTEDEWRQVVEDLGLTIPEGWSVRLVEARFDPVAWTREEPFYQDREGNKLRSPAITRPVWRYRFAVERASANAVLDEALLAAALKAKGTPNVTTFAPGAYVIAIGDTQIGKVDLNGGTYEAVNRILRSVDLAIARYKSMPKASRPTTIVLALLGDHVEGLTSQGGRLAWRVDLGVTDMVRVWRRTLLEIVRRVARLGVDVVVAGISGNHDEAIRQPVTTYANDSWAIDAMSAVADVCAENTEAFGRVTFRFPEDDRLDLTIEVGGTIITLAHGHKWKSGKAMEWWAGQAHGMQPAGHSTLLLSGHYHHLAVLTDGAKTHVQVPAMDGGSGWWRDSTGLDAEPGLVTLLVRDGAWSGLEVL
jgi:predicted phosphodiesterase